MPTRSAICLGGDSPEPQAAARRAALTARGQQRPQGPSVLDLIQTQIDVASVSTIAASSRSLPPPPLSIDRVLYELPAIRPSTHLSSRSMSSSAASSSGGGARSSRWDSSGGRGAQPQVQFLQASRHLDRPAVVAEVPPDLTHDGRGPRMTRNRNRFRVEADHRRMTDPRHLNQVVAGLTAPVEPAGDVIGQRQASLDDPVPMPLELRRFRFQLGQFPEHVRDVGVLGSRPDDEPPAARDSPRGACPPRGQADAEDELVRAGVVTRWKVCTSSVSELSMPAETAGVTTS